MTSPGKSRVRCRYATGLLSRGGTQGSRTLIRPAKSRVPCQLSERPMVTVTIVRLVLDRGVECSAPCIGYTPPVFAGRIAAIGG